MNTSAIQPRSEYGLLHKSKISSVNHQPDVTHCVLLLSVDQVFAAQYFNSSETDCDDSDPSVLFWNDFEGGDCTQTNGDPTRASSTTTGTVN